MVANCVGWRYIKVRRNRIALFANLRASAYKAASRKIVLRAHPPECSLPSPNRDAKNLVIATTGRGATKEFCALIAN